jgi:hypothetical protein
MSKKPVVIYGASGYTGRLVAEYLREYQIPFVAAGRNGKAIKEVMSQVPGIETADYEVIEVEHTVEALTKLFEGRKIVCNTVGPFARFAPEVLEAALAAQVHYLDTGGEQEFVRSSREKYSDAFAEKGLVLAHSVAYMFTTLDIAARIVMENEGLHTLEGSVLAQMAPTYGSTQTIFTILPMEMCYLENNELVEWPRCKGYEVSFPGRLVSSLCHPWSGGMLPLWLQDNPQIRNVKQVTGFENRELFEQLIELQKHYETNLCQLPKAEREEEMSKLASGMTPEMPPRENRLLHESLDVVVGRGASETRTCIIRSGPVYMQTGLFQAATVAKLLQSGPEKTGFCSATDAVGYKYLLGALKTFFATEVEIF